MSVVTVNYLLTGPLKGKTITLGSNTQYPFVDGALELSAPAEEISLHSRFLAKNWQAYPEGSDLLKGAEDGVGDISTSESENEQQTVSGDLQSEGQQTASGESTEDKQESTDAEAGTSGSLPIGDGQQAQLDVDSKLVTAIEKLDPKNEDHWTQQGKPAIEAVSKFYGSSNLTRADIEAAKPDFRRTV